MSSRSLAVTMLLNGCLGARFNSGLLHFLFVTNYLDFCVLDTPGRFSVAEPVLPIRFGRLNRRTSTLGTTYTKIYDCQFCQCPLDCCESNSQMYIPSDVCGSHHDALLHLQRVRTSSLRRPGRYGASSPCVRDISMKCYYTELRGCFST